MLIRYIHANGASMFFLVVYIHILEEFIMARIVIQDSLYGQLRFYSVYYDWYSFYGLYFTLGQMSFWAATVITNLASALPVVGKPIVLWLWGGFSVDMLL